MGEVIDLRRYFERVQIMNLEFPVDENYEKPAGVIWLPEARPEYFGLTRREDTASGAD